LFPDGPFRDRHVVRAIVRADEAIAFGAELVESGIAGPDVLGEPVLPDQAGAADKCGDSSLYTVFWSALRQRRPVGPATADDAAPVHVHRRIARIHAADMRTKWDGVAVR